MTYLVKEHGRSSLLDVELQSQGCSGQSLKASMQEFGESQYSVNDLTEDVFFSETKSHHFSKAGFLG